MGLVIDIVLLCWVPGLSWDVWGEITTLQAVPHQDPCCHLSALPTSDTKPEVQPVFAELAQVGFAFASRDLQRSCKQLGCLFLISVYFAVKMTKHGISFKGFFLCS